MPERQLNVSLSQWCVQAITRLWCTFAVVQGVLISTGGRERWSGPALQVALTAPGAPVSWGVVLGILGLIGLLGTFRRPKFKLVFYMMLGIATWLLFFTVSLLIAVLTNPIVPTTGVVTYVTMAVTSTVVGSVYRASRK